MFPRFVILHAPTSPIETKWKSRPISHLVGFTKEAKIISQSVKIQLQKSLTYLLPTFSIVFVQQNLNTGTIVRMNISEVFHLNRKTEQKRQQELLPPLQMYSL